MAIADTVYRYSAPAGVGAPTLSRGEASRGEAAPSVEAIQVRLEEMLDRADSSEPMSGWQWDELTGALSAVPSLVIVPRRLWFDVAARLLEEMLVSDGLPWMQRYEAFHRLLGHPTGERAAVAACVSLIGDPANQIFVEPVSVLDASSHPDASRFVLGQLVQPINERARYGALLACVRKVRFGHFAADEVAGLVPTVSDLLRDPDSYADAAALGVELLRRLPNGLGTRAVANLRRALTADAHLNEVLGAGRLAAQSTSAIVVDRIASATQAQLPQSPPGFTDTLLPELIDEMLYAPVLDVRLYAALLVRATPYGGAVARALGKELRKPHVAMDPTLAATLLGGMRILGEASQRPLVEHLVLAVGLPIEVSIAAVDSLGHVGGVSPDRFYLDAIARHAGSWRRHRTRHSAVLLRGLVYALGVTQNLRLLARVRDDHEAPAPVRAAARWWLDRPARVFESARR